MCNQHIMQLVRAKAAQVSNPQRRNFLRAGAAMAGAMAIAPASQLLQPSPRIQLRQGLSGEIVDLSYALKEGIALYGANDMQPSSEVIVTIEENGFFKRKWTFDEHSSTHVDAPAHFDLEGLTVDELPAEMLIAPLVVIDISAKSADDPDATLTADDILNWEASNGEIPAGALVAMYSGWGSRWDDPAAYRNADADGVLHFPGFAGDAATLLIEERDIVGIGVDTMSLDPGNSTTFDAHLTVLPAGKYGVENLSNLEAVKDRAAMVMVGVPRYFEGSGGPCRVLAML